MKRKDKQKKDEDGEGGDGSSSDETVDFDMGSALDHILDSTADVRERALANLDKHFRHTYDVTLATAHESALLHGILRAMKKGEKGDLVRGMEVLGLLVLTLGANAEESLFLALDDVLKAHAGHKAEAVQRVAVQTLALLTFVAGPDEAASRSLLSFLDARLARGDRSAEIVAGELQAWGFVASIVATDVIVGHHFEVHLKHCAALLEHTAAEVHVAAANNIALLMDMWRDAMELDGQEFAIEDCSVLDVADLVVQIADLARAASKQSKAAAHSKREWRTALRDVSTYLNEMVTAQQHNDEPPSPPSESLTVMHQDVTLTGFAQLQQLYFLRAALHSGFLHHMTHNELLHDIFSIEIDPKAKATFLSKTEKRQVMSPNSAAAKTRTNIRGKGRQTKLAQAMSALDE